MAWVDQIVYWHWLALGVLLVILEAFSPGVFLIWLGIAAAVVGGALWLFPDLAWELQLWLFAVFSVTTILLWRERLRRHPTPSDQPKLNRRGEQYVGRLFTLNEPIVNGLGKIRVDDSTWKVAGQDCGPGTRVRVTGVDGVVLKIEIVSE
ncbi:MAG: NfeD family protein [Gammaproteobacteria bacterium]|nr:NfeD family protein [Gammaproteobacteria bacterium]